MQWSGSDQRGTGQTIDLRNASLANFERLEIGTSAILRLTGSQYSQFSSGVSKIAGYEGATNLAIDLSPREELRFSKTAGINSASGALNISGADSAFSDTLAINSDGTVDLSDPNTLISNVEILEIQRGTVILTAEQWNSFDNIKAKGSDRKTISLTDNEQIDLSKFSRSSDSHTTLNLNLTVDQINSDDFRAFSAKFATTTGSKAIIDVQGTGIINRQDWPISIIIEPGQATFAASEIIGTAEDDDFELRLLGPFNITGGEGLDTTLQADSNISQGMMSSIELLNLNDFSIRMGSTQLNSFEQIIGSGEIHLVDGDYFNSDVITGANDNTSSGITIHQPTPGYRDDSSLRHSWQ